MIAEHPEGEAWRHRHAAQVLAQIGSPTTREVPEYREGHRQLPSRMIERGNGISRAKFAATPMRIAFGYDPVAGEVLAALLKHPDAHESSSPVRGSPAFLGPHGDQ
jgi:hypothetical protein